MEAEAAKFIGAGLAGTALIVPVSVLVQSSRTTLQAHCATHLQPLVSAQTFFLVSRFAKRQAYSVSFSL